LFSAKRGDVLNQGIEMIVIFGIKENLNPIKAQLSDVIHSCMESVLGFPEDKRAHRLFTLLLK
jgi:hypothetical protein